MIKYKTIKETCWHCSGLGTIAMPIPPYLWGNRIICPTCSGTGYIEKQIKIETNE